MKETTLYEILNVENTEVQATEVKEQQETRKKEETKVKEQEEFEIETLVKVPVNFVKEHKETVAIVGGGIITVLILGLASLTVLKRRKKKKAKLQQFEEIEEVFTEPILSTGAAQDIGDRENQQDNYCICEDPYKGVLAVVADGMGGLENGAEVSGIVTYVFKEYFKQTAKFDYPEFDLLQMVINANQNVCNYISSTGGKMSGSTLVAAYVKADELYFATIGDSHIYLMRNGGLIQLNREHVYGAELDEEMVRGNVTANEALSHRERKSLTSYMGMKEIAHVDRNTTPVRLLPGDKLLLASDGVFGTIFDEEIERALSASTPERAAELLIHAVKEKRKRRQDNATAVVLFYE